MGHGAFLGGIQRRFIPSLLPYSLFPAVIISANDDEVFMRPSLAILGVAFLACSTAHAQLSTCATAGNDNAFLNIQTIRLWPGDAPEAKGTTCNDIPTLTILGPRMGTANGSAVIVLPGGAYLGLAADLEGREVADWFTVRGFRAFVLSYRLSSHGYLLPVPLLDARRAVQLVRARARDYQINPNRIVIIGFSAGGHLAALAGTQFVPGKADAEDPIGRVSSRPDYLVLGYAWLGAISSDTSHLSYCKLFDVMDRCEALRKAYEPDLYVTKDTPPTFMYHTFTDDTVPVEQALSFYDALVKAGVTSELHVFANGAHGSGLGKGDPALDHWPELMEEWLRGQGLLTVDKDAVGAKP
jgi:acetyl esterase/lipase